MKGILARKIGMTRIICADTGKMIPVTVLEAPQATVLQIKTVEKDGYAAAVIGSSPRKDNIKNYHRRYRFIRELPLCEGQEIKTGDTISVNDLNDVAKVKLTSTSKGKGFAGVIKRHNFSRGPETHGSGHHREPGSVGMCAKPARILKGKKLPGRYGHDQTTLRSVDVVKIDSDQNLIAVKGGVPGSTNTWVFIRGIAK